MAHERLLDGLATFGSSYVKRFLETHYDSLMRTGPARKVMEAGAPTRYGIEAALYALLAYAEQHWSADTPLRSLIREVAMDAPSEISKRLVNGFRDEVLSVGRKGASGEARGVEQALLTLDDETLGALLTWLAEVKPEEMKRVRSLLAKLSDEELEKIARLHPEDVEALLGPPPTPTPIKSPSRLRQAIKEQLEQGHRRADEQLAARRKRRQP